MFSINFNQDQEPDTSWVLDSLVGFLQGPIWNIPIISFIEQKSISELKKDDKKLKFNC